MVELCTKARITDSSTPAFVSLTTSSSPAENRGPEFALGAGAGTGTVTVTLFVAVLLVSWAATEAEKPASKAKNSREAEVFIKKLEIDFPITHPSMKQGFHRHGQTIGPCPGTQAGSLTFLGQP